MARLNLRKSLLALVFALLVTAMLAQPVATDAQCSVTTTTIQDFPPTRAVTKILASNGTCRSIGNNNVLGCFPGAAPQATILLVASASTAAVSPSCSWQCTCGTSITNIKIDGSDGLPVELMSFSIE